jgi:Fe-Mn family superoxide dismutase
MEIHHSKHHNAYTTNLNAAAAGTDMEGEIENILINLDMKNTAVRNNGGGFYNHNLLECNDSNGGGLPTGDLLQLKALLELLKSLKQN